MEEYKCNCGDPDCVGYVGEGLDQMDPEYVRRLQQQYLAYAEIPSVISTPRFGSGKVTFGVLREHPEAIFIAVTSFAEEGNPEAPDAAPPTPGRVLSIVVKTNDFGAIADSFKAGLAQLQVGNDLQEMLKAAIAERGGTDAASDDADGGR